MKISSIAAIIIGIIIVGIVVVVIIVGGKSTQPTETTEPKEPTEITSPAEDLSSILGRASGVNNLSYEEIVTTPDLTTTSKIWIKGQKIKRETIVEGEKTVIIVNGEKQTYINYIPKEEMAIKMDFTEYKAEESPVDRAGSIPAVDTKILSNETVDGKVCTVVEYKTSEGTAKTWIWKDKGIPIKMEIVTPTGKTTTEYKNIKIGNVKDSDFELPTGVKLQEFEIPKMPEPE